MFIEEEYKNELSHFIRYEENERRNTMEGDIIMTCDKELAIIKKILKCGKAKAIIISTSKEKTINSWTTMMTNSGINSTELEIIEID